MSSSGSSLASSPPIERKPSLAKSSAAVSSASDAESALSQRCLVCSAQATGFHFDAQSCSACAAFFRRTIALAKSFKCINGLSECRVHYSMHQICRACRFAACTKAGMNKGGVQPRRGNSTQRRAFFTRSGLKRNKRFAVLAAPVDDDEQACIEEAAAAAAGCSSDMPMTTITAPSSVTSASSSSCAPSPSGASSCHPLPSSRMSDIGSRAYSSTAPSTPMMLSSYSMPTSPMPPRSPLLRPLPQIHPTLTPPPNALDLLIREEMRLGEKRRIVFCERPVERMLGANKNCPFTRDDIRPLSFRTFRKQIRTHILFIYEWLQAWPDYATLENTDRVSMLRSCVLLHTILDPIYITLQIGLPDRFVMQNGGFISCTNDEGWEDESEISGETKRRIYDPLLRKIMGEIVPPMLALGMTFEEFVALKAFVSFQGALSGVSPSAREAMRRQLTAVTASLHARLVSDGAEPAERIGGLILLLSGIFSTGLEFVVSHRQIHFFDLWQLDSLLLQLLNLDSILETTQAGGGEENERKAREEEETRGVKGEDMET